jgi:integrase
MPRRVSSETKRVVKATNLLTASLAPSTIVKYDKHASQFYDWLMVHGHNPCTFIELDMLLSSYLQQLYDGGIGKAAAASTVYGLNVSQPGITKHLPYSLKSLQGFQRLKPSKQHPPLPWPVTCVIAVSMWLRGYLREGIVTLLAFDCYLRINEALSLCREDVALGEDPRLGAGRPDRLYLRLSATKTGDNQGVEVLNTDVKKLVLLVIDCIKPRTRLFPFSDAHYRRIFHLVCDDLKLASDYVPHSLRHGGATYGFLCDMPLADILLRGRWKSTGSGTHYIQSYRQVMMQRTIPPLVITASKYIMQRSLFDLFGESLV